MRAGQSEAVYTPIHKRLQSRMNEMNSVGRSPLANRTNQITNSSVKREIDKDFVQALENFDYQ